MPITPARSPSATAPLTLPTDRPSTWGSRRGAGAGARDRTRTLAIGTSHRFVTSGQLFPVPLSGRGPRAGFTRGALLLNGARAVHRLVQPGQLFPVLLGGSGP